MRIFTRVTSCHLPATQRWASLVLASLAATETGTAPDRLTLGLNAGDIPVTCDVGAGLSLRTGTLAADQRSLARALGGGGA